MDLFGDDPVEYDDDIDDTEDSGEIAAPEQLFVDPRAMSFISGHENIETELLKLYNDGRVPHGLVFTGPKGIGKATMAYRFARFFFKHGIKDSNQSSMFGEPETITSLDVKSDDPVFRRVASSGHGDLLSAERKFDEAKSRFKDSLDVEEIRRIAPFLRMTSSEGGWRIVIIDDADTMNRNAQNALLKILEEPPKNTVIILIAHRAGALLPTIRSRTRYMHFAPLNDETLADLLRKKSSSLSKRDIEMLSSLSDGSFGKALQYAEEEAPRMLESLLVTLANAPNWPWLEIHKLSDRLSGPGSDNSYDTFQELMIWILNQATRSRARGIQPPEALRDFLKNSSLEELLKICENLESHFARSDYANLDRRQAVLGAFALIAA